MPYGGSPSTDASDAVRLLVGDIGTTTATQFLADADYDYFVSLTPNHYAAAILAANSLAALNGGRGITKTVGDLSYTLGNAAHYRALAKTFELRQAAGVAPFAGGISKADKASAVADSDRVQPAFVRGQFDNPAAGTEST